MPEDISRYTRSRDGNHCRYSHQRTRYILEDYQRNPQGFSRYGLFLRIKYTHCIKIPYKLLFCTYFAFLRLADNFYLESFLRGNRLQIRSHRGKYETSIDKNMINIPLFAIVWILPHIITDSPNMGKVLILWAFLDFWSITHHLPCDHLYDKQ